MFHQTRACTLLYAALIAAVLSGYPRLQPKANAAAVAAPPAKENRVSPSVDFPTIVERYGPAVVHISTVSAAVPGAAASSTAASGAAASGATAPDQQASTPALAEIDADDPLLAFVKHAASDSQPSQGGSARAITGTGSGFIVSPDGLILTTAHVVDQADEVTVRLTDRREFKAKVLAVDIPSDVAVIQIDATKLPTVKLGDSSRVRVGESVLAIGSPDSFANTVAAGIVSATSRTLQDGSNFPFFQTDLAADPNNSGGPLFNRAGEVVGIDVQIYAALDRSPSLAFAIPINVAAKVRSQVLAAQTPPSPGGLGVEVQDVGPGLAVAFGLPHPAGALVNSVVPGTSAAASGVKPGDVIIRIGDKAIDRSAELGEDAAGLPSGTKTTLRLIRNHRAMTIPVTLGASTESPKDSPMARPSEASARGDRLGLSMHPLNEDERRTSDLAVGLMVDSVDGPAASAGIQPGDIILSLNDTLVETQADVTALEAKAGKQVAVLIQRNHARSFVSVEVR
ncbi:trypsin-like peptidase domain-containing protein [Paraburkholderia phenazinium]|uniref:Probable periplasmic serine endoprotease DegP-like n=1 Tax=Paraburkholderia phenazinium TaxID=60549 RepID=A0A1G8LKN0_9BURK|nr:trypsin-like peptidase domain-containing protein [Paraburkholderia phenazinium]SDI56226.1 serine protease, S1-C subfamily, contains C-terminal PDZ domain [Paraburkholderia phenazinium]